MKHYFVAYKFLSFAALNIVRQKRNTIYLK